METIHLTWAEFKELPEYSCTIPTGTTIGKRWKRNDHAFRGAKLRPSWFMGEFVEAPTTDAEYPPNTVLIVWRRIVIRLTVQAAA